MADGIVVSDLKWSQVSLVSINIYWTFQNLNFDKENNKTLVLETVNNKTLKSIFPTLP